MDESYIDPTEITQPKTAVALDGSNETQLATLFNLGYGYLMNRQWKKAEKIFAKIESYNSHYEQGGLQASALRRKAQYERIANNALETGELEAALIAFKKADDFKQANEVHHLLTIQELQDRAEKATSHGNYQEAAWLYDHLLNSYPQDSMCVTWQIKKESCWEAELLPFYLLGVQALEKQQWHTAYKAFAQVLAIDPYFRQGGRSAAALSETARKELVRVADQMLREGEVHRALNIYREIGHVARIENVDEFLRLRQREEETAVSLEAEGKWQEAALKYSYLATLYYNDEERKRWHEAVTRCQKSQKLATLYTQAMSAFNQKQWREATRLFEQILALQPDYQPGEQPVRKLYRVARWRSITSQFLSQTNNPPPKVNSGKLS